MIDLEHRKRERKRGRKRGRKRNRLLSSTSTFTVTFSLMLASTKIVRRHKLRSAIAFRASRGALSSMLMLR